MPIRFRCQHCQQLMSIATRKAGCEVPCPRCQRTTVVPAPPAAPPDEPAATPAAAASSRPFGVEGASSDGAPVTSEGAAEAEEYGAPFTRRPPPMEELDMTPMVDMTFLLLIFFMVTATFSQQKTLQVPSPDSDKKGAATSLEEVQNIQEASIRIAIDARNAIRIEDEPVSDPSQLAAMLREKMRTELKSEAILEIAPAALHETVVRAVDACNEAGLQKIRLGAKRDADAGG